MKFSVAVAISALAASVSAGALPARFVLVEGTYTFLTNYNNIFSRININRNPPLILESTDGTSASYLARMQDVADIQSLFAIPDGIERVGLTAPRSAVVPAGAKTTGFGMNEDRQLTFNNRGYFAIDGSTGLIYVDDAEVCNNTEIIATKVYVKEVDASFESL